MKVQMPQQDQRLKKHWLHFRILVTGKWNFTWFHVFSRYFTNFSLFFQFDEMSDVTWQTEFTILPITGYNNFDEINFKNSPSFVSTATNWHPWVISRNFCLFHDFPNFCVYFTGNYVLNYLYNQPKLAQFVIQGLVTLFARITNLGWFDSKDDDFVFRNVIGKWFDDFWQFLAISRNFFSHFRWCDEIFTRAPCWSLHDWSSAFIPTHLWNESGKIFTKFHKFYAWFQFFHQKFSFFTDFRSRRQS